MKEFIAAIVIALSFCLIGGFISEHDRRVAAEERVANLEAMPSIPKPSETVCIAADKMGNISYAITGREHGRRIVRERSM